MTILKLSTEDRQTLKSLSSGMVSVTEAVIGLAERGIHIRAITTTNLHNEPIEVLSKNGKMFYDLTYDAGQVDEHNWPVLQSVVVLI